MNPLLKMNKTPTAVHGWLKIQSKYLKRWQLRYVRVEDDEIKCFHVGRPCKTYRIVSVHGHRGEDNYLLDIHTSDKRVYQVQMKGEAYYKRWLNVLKRAVE